MGDDTNVPDDKAAELTEAELEQAAGGKHWVVIPVDKTVSNPRDAANGLPTG